MKKILSGIWAIVLFAGIYVSFCQAQTAYVSDLLILTFRDGPGASYAVVKTLKSNTPLTILNEKNGFYNVSLASGEQGWVDKQFVMFETPKTLVIEQLNREKAGLEDQIKRLKEASEGDRKESLVRETGSLDTATGLTKQLADLQEKNRQLSLDLKQSRTEFTALKKAAKDVTATLNDNKRLKAENKRLSQSIEHLNEDTGTIFKTEMIKWFLAGFGVLLMGWIIGKSVSPSRKKGSSLLD